jgi:hypothetical protein
VLCSNNARNNAAVVTRPMQLLAEAHVSGRVDVDHRILIVGLFCRVDHPSDLIWMTSPDDPHRLLEGTGWAPHTTRGTNQQQPSDTLVTCIQRGHALYSSSSYIDALHAYLRGLKALEATGIQAGAASRQLRIDLLNNCAACCLSLGTPEAAATGVGYARAAHQAAGPGGNSKGQLREATLLMGAGR